MQHLPSPVASPCVNICRMSAASATQPSVCLGCWRTIDEIARWSRLDDAAKRGVWAQLDARRTELRGKVLAS
jgi:uncharacterized protein